MVKVYDRFDFPSELPQNLNPLLDMELIAEAEYLEKGTAYLYEITENEELNDLFSNAPNYLTPSCMDFEHFDKLSTDEAKAFLNNFLTQASKGFLSIIPEIELSCVRVDFSMESLLPVFQWVIDRLKTVPEKEDNSLPEWIRATESYKKGLYSFDGPSGVLILRFAYYLGECFIRCHTGLKWSMGNRSKMQRNMPVISGFKSKMELPVLVVSKNMFASAIENKHTEGAATAITTWRLFT